MTEEVSDKKQVFLCK